MRDLTRSIVVSVTNTETVTVLNEPSNVALVAIVAPIVVVVLVILVALVAFALRRRRLQLADVRSAREERALGSKRSTERSAPQVHHTYDTVLVTSSVRSNETSSRQYEQALPIYNSRTQYVDINDIPQ